MLILTDLQLKYLYLTVLANRNLCLLTIRLPHYYCDIARWVFGGWALSKCRSQLFVDMYHFLGVCGIYAEVSLGRISDLLFVDLQSLVFADQFVGFQELNSVLRVHRVRGLSWEKVAFEHLSKGLRIAAKGEENGLRALIDCSQHFQRKVSHSVSEFGYGQKAVGCVWEALHLQYSILI